MKGEMFRQGYKVEENMKILLRPVVEISNVVIPRII